MSSKLGCAWPGDDVLMIRYHDEEWGTPVHDDRKLFEYMVLDGMQAGLSWSTVLHKRENLQRSFLNFEPKKVSRFTEKDVNRLLKDTGIIRNRLKINATITNARRFLEVQQEFGTFDKFIWKFVNYETIVHRFRKLSELPDKTKESDAMSKELNARGFKFVGSTICYAFMQAAGMVNDHAIDCFRYAELNGRLGM